MRDSTFAVLAMVGVVAAIAAAGVAVAAADSGGGRVQAVYVDGSGTLAAVDTTGEVRDFGVSAAAVGALRDFDGNGDREAAFVTSQGVLKLVGPDGGTTTLARDVASSKTAIASGDLDGDGTPAVFYANTSDSGYVYRVEVGATPIDPERVTATAAKGVFGVADFDGDDGRELVFAGSSSTVKYLDDGTVRSTDYSSIGSNNGLGLGRVADFDGDGTARAVLVDGSNNLVLVAADGSTTMIPMNMGARKAAVTATDWTGDERPEVLFTNKDGELAYAALDGSSGVITASSGSAVAPQPGPGLGAAFGPTAPDVTSFTLTNPTGRTLNVSFTVDTRLATLRVGVDGPVERTLDRDAFTVAGNGPYTYNASITVRADGAYTATLQEAVGPHGLDGASGANDTVTVETPAPTVTTVSLWDVSDDDGVVGPGDTLAVTAAVDAPNGPATVWMDASAFGAGRVPLERENGTWRGEFTVDESAVDTNGPTAVTVGASNEYDNRDDRATGTVVLDTVRPLVSLDDALTVQPGAQVAFNASDATDRTRIAAYRWSFGDGATARGPTVTHDFAEPGTYVVTVAVEDAAGNVATKSRTVVVEREDTTTTDGDGGDATDTMTTDDGTTVVDTPTEVTVTVAERAGGVRFDVTHANADDRVSIAVPVLDAATNATLTGVRVVPVRDGAFTVNVSSRATTPVDGRALTERDVRALAYWQVNTSLAPDAVGNGALTFTVPRERLGDADPRAVALYHRTPAGWETVNAHVVTSSNESVTFRATVPGFSVYAAGVREAAVRVTHAELSDYQVTVGERVLAEATVRNTGSREETRRIAVTVGNRTVASKSVTVPAGANRTVTFAWMADTTDEATVRVRGEVVGSLTVVRAADATTTSQSPDTTRSSGGAPLSPVVLLAGLFAAACYLLRRGRS